MLMMIPLKEKVFIPRSAIKEGFEKHVLVSTQKMGMKIGICSFNVAVEAENKASVGGILGSEPCKLLPTTLVKDVSFCLDTFFFKFKEIEVNIPLIKKRMSKVKSVYEVGEPLAVKKMRPKKRLLKILDHEPISPIREFLGPVPSQLTCNNQRKSPLSMSQNS